MNDKRFLVFTQPVHNRHINDFGCLRFSSDKIDSARDLAKKACGRNECASIYDREVGNFVALV